MNIYPIFGRTVFGKRYGALAKIKAIDLGTNLLNGAKIPYLFPSIDNFINAMSRNAGNGPTFQLNLMKKLGYVHPSAVGINHGCLSGLLLMNESRLHVSEEKQPTLNLLTAVESISNSPLLVKNQQKNHEKETLSEEMIDHNDIDGLLCPQCRMTPLEQVARYYNQHLKDHYSRLDLDAYAVESHKKANDAWENSIYKRDVYLHHNLTKDETIRKVNGLSFSSFGTVPGRFNSNVSPSNVCSPSDGAAFLLMGTEKSIKDSNGKTYHSMARLVSVQEGNSSNEETFLSVFDAITKMLKKNNLTTKDIDVWELSDPFAVLGLLYCEKLNISFDKLNRYGGTISLGHPSSVTGLRLVQNCLLAFEHNSNSRFAIAASPGIMGKAVAVLIERLC
jgi:acetyl-CoA acetyltransferase